jgi:hypothetical protein
MKPRATARSVRAYDRSWRSACHYDPGGLRDVLEHATMPDVSSTWTVATTLLTTFGTGCYPAPETIHRIHQG